jgi:hypothetical protein
MRLTRRSMLAASCGAIAAVKAAPAAALSLQDDQFLEDLSHHCFQYFWEYTDPDSGMTRGRAKADGTPYDANRRDIGSIAVTGFGLAGLCIAAERGWVKPDEARTRVRNALRFFCGTCAAGSRLVLSLDERQDRRAHRPAAG